MFLTKEALMYKKAGARILGITQNDSSLLAEESHNILILPKSNLPSAPNYFTFICSFLTLILIGLRIGEVRMNETMDDYCRRFISIIDEFYDRKVKVIMSAEGPALDLYTGSKLSEEFKRTSSRIAEMQTQSYLATEHKS